MAARHLYAVPSPGPAAPPQVQDIDFNGSEHVVVWYDPWRQSDRTCRYVGRCVVCGRRTWAFDDGENDPRGVLGDHAAAPLVAEDYDCTGGDVPLCFLHANEEWSYKSALDIARRVLWRTP